MKKVIKNNYKIIIGFILGLIFSITSVYAIEAYIESNKVSYDNKHTEKDNVQDAIDELYERSGIHKEKWVDPILNGADPVLKDPLIPVEIKQNGDTYYANLNSEWYNYSEKRWANAVILTDTSKAYTVGEKIDDKDVESYFVWIPRYKYKIWDLGKYAKSMTFEDLTNAKATATAETSLWRLNGNNTRIINVKFGTISKIPKMNENEASLNNYYTHPAFTLGNKDLNGLWVGKFETGGTSANDMVIKPNVVSWRNEIVKTFFDAGKDFATGLDSHMMKNTEWGAIAYLSHSEYGIGSEININNASDYMTGYSAASGTDQSTIPGESAASSDYTITQPWNTSVGYLASTTGNISGIYDMSGGAWEYVAACVKGQVGNSGFADEAALTAQVTAGYIDEYSTDSTITSYDKRILGDATGEMGPFYSYFENDGTSYYHSSWYGDGANFVESGASWFYRGSNWYGGALPGQFAFSRKNGRSGEDNSFRIVLAPLINS